MAYGLQIYSGLAPDEEVVFSTKAGDTFLKKMYKTSFGPVSGTAPIVLSSIPAGLNRTNSVICVSVTEADNPIVGNARAVFTGPESLNGEGEITIAKCFEPAGNVTGFIEVLQYEGMELSPDTFGLLVTDPAGDLIIDHDSVVWGIQYGGTLEDQGWFGYVNNGGEYCEYRIQELPKDTFAVGQPFGLAVRRSDPSHWVVQPDFLTDGDEFYTAVRFHRKSDEKSDLHFIIVVPADETMPPILTDDSYGLEIYGPGTTAGPGELGWSSRWHQAVVKHIHEMNQGYEHTPASPSDDYNIDAGYDGVTEPLAYYNSPQGVSESAQFLRSEGRWANSVQGTNPYSVWSFGRTHLADQIYTLFSTGTAYVQYYKGMKTLDGVNEGLQGGGLHSWATLITNIPNAKWCTHYVIDMFRLGDGPDPPGPSQYCARALPSYHPTGHCIFLGSTYVGPVLPPSTFCLTGRQIETSIWIQAAQYNPAENHYSTDVGFIPDDYTEFTFICCFKPTETFPSAQWGNILEIGWTDGDPLLLWGLWWNQSDGGFEFWTDLTDNGYVWLYNNTAGINYYDGNWHTLYVTCRINQSSQTYDGALWVDGTNLVTLTNEPTNGNGNDYFKGHSSIDPRIWFGSMEQMQNHDLSFVWCDDQYLDPATYYSTFFNGTIPRNIGVNGEALGTGQVPLNYFPDGSPIYQYGTLADTAGYSFWYTTGHVLESLTNPTLCPQRLDGGDWGALCVTGRQLDETGINYYESATGFLNYNYEKITFICCLNPKTSTVDGYIYSTTPDGAGNMPFFIGIKANGNFWIGFRTDYDENFEWDGDILTQNAWNSVYITIYYRPDFNQIHLEIYNNGSQGVSSYFSSVSERLLAHNLFGPAYIGRGPGTGDAGVNADFSYIVVDDEYWYQGDYYQEFFDAQNRPYPLGENSDDITGQVPLVFYPSGSPVKYVEVSNSTWQVFGWVPESQTNPSPCPRKNDGGDGTLKSARYIPGYEDASSFMYGIGHLNPGWIFAPQSEKKDIAVYVFCLKPDVSYLGATLNWQWWIPIFDGGPLLIAYESMGDGTGYIEFNQYGFANPNGYNVFLRTNSTFHPPIIEGQWNTIVAVVYVNRNNEKIVLDTVINGTHVYDEWTHYAHTNGDYKFDYDTWLDDYDKGWAYANDMFIGVTDFDDTDPILPAHLYEGFALSNLYIHYQNYNPEAGFPSALDVYNNFFDTSGVPKVSGNAEAVLGETPYHYMPDGSFFNDAGLYPFIYGAHVSENGTVSEASSTIYGTPLGYPDYEGPNSYGVVMNTTHEYPSEVETGSPGGYGIYFQSAVEERTRITWYEGGTLKTSPVIHADYPEGQGGQILEFFALKVTPVSGLTDYMLVQNWWDGNIQYGQPPSYGINKWIPVYRAFIYSLWLYDDGINFPNDYFTTGGTATVTYDVSVAKIKNLEAMALYEYPTDSSWNIVLEVFPETIVTKRFTHTVTGS